MLEDLAEVLHLRRHEQPRGRLLHVMHDAFGRGVGPVRGAERVVDVDIRERGKRLREAAVVLLFLRVKPEVLEQHDLAAL